MCQEDVCLRKRERERERGSEWKRERERKTRRASKRGVYGWTRWSSPNKPPRGCRVVSVCTGSVFRPWCQCAAWDTVPCWHWRSSWDAAWCYASAKTTRSQSYWKASVWWSVTPTPPRTEESPPRLGYLSAPLAPRWLSPRCAGLITSRRRWATRPWLSILTRWDQSVICPSWRIICTQLRLFYWVSFHILLIWFDSSLDLQVTSWEPVISFCGLLCASGHYANAY